MIIFMRTTLVLDDDLLRRAKAYAAKQNLTVSELVSGALRRALAEPDPAPVSFRMVTFGEGEERLHHEPEQFSPACDDEPNMRGG